MAPPLLTSALDGGEWWASRPGCFTPGERAPDSHWERSREAEWALNPVWTLWDKEKSLAPAVNRTPAVQPIARRYTDCAIPAPRNMMELVYEEFYVLGYNAV
jgi:hypothetical protein